MHRWSWVRPTMTATIILFGVGACGDDSGEGSQSISDPQAFEAAAKKDLVPIVEGINNGLARVLTALGGGALDGVTLTPFTGGVNAVIQIDFDGNGSREGSINAGFTGDIAAGAPVNVNSVTGDDNSLIVEGGMTATETSPGVILLDDLSGGGETDPPGSGNSSTVAITDGAVTLDAAAGVPSGFVDMDVSGDANSISVSFEFIPDGHGGFSIHVTGDGLDFTVP